MRNRNFAAIAAMLLSSTVFAGVAQAQDAAPASKNSEGDIIVTARRGNETLIDVPVQVNVVTAQRLSMARADDLAKIAENIPFVTIVRLSSGNGGGITVRGIGNFGVDVGTGQSVVMNFDNVFIGRPRIVTQSMFDVDQVEVLKGPQALYFGKNTPAGVVSIKSADPGRTLQFIGKAGYEFTADQQYYEGALSAPLTDTLRVRVAGRFDKMKGYMHNVAVPVVSPAGSVTAGELSPGTSSPRTPNERTWGLRLTTVWEPFDGLKARLKYTHAQYNGNGQGNNYETYCAVDPNAVGHTFGFADPQVDCKADRNVAMADPLPSLLIGMRNPRDGKPYADTASDVVALDLNYDMGSLAVSSTSAYYKLKYEGLQNLLNTAYAFNATYQMEKVSAWSEELRINSKFDGPFNFTIGGYYSKEKQFNESDSATNPPYTPNTSVAPGSRFYNSRLSYVQLYGYTTETSSIFASGSFDILKNLNLSGGARYSYTKKYGNNGHLYSNPVLTVPPATGFPLIPSGTYFIRSMSDDNVSPEVTLTWKPTPDQNLYAAYKTGYRPGGFSNPAGLRANVTDAGTRFLPEKNEGFEIGYKARLFDRRATLQLTAYHYTYTNQQITTFVASQLLFITGNAGKSRVQGAEAEATFNVTPDFNLRAAVGYNDTIYKSFPGASCWAGQTVAEGCFKHGTDPSASQDLSNRRAPRAPVWAWSFGGTYTTDVGNGLKLSLNGDATYTGKQNTNDALNPYSVQNGYVRVNAGITVQTEDEKWRVSLLGRNITNQYKHIYTQDRPASGVRGEIQGIFTRPREIALEVGMKL